MKTLRTFILALTVCAIVNVLNTAAMACPANDPACAVPEELACDRSDPGCAVPEELACNGADSGCNAVPVELACVAGVDCKIRVLRGAALACNGDSGAGCKIAPMPKTLFACDTGSGCVAIAVLPPPEIA